MSGDDFWDRIWEEQCDGRTEACQACNPDGGEFFIPLPDVSDPLSACATCQGVQYVKPTVTA